MLLDVVVVVLCEIELLDGGVIIVDNDLGDGLFEKMLQVVCGWLWVVVVQLGWNGGFGVGNNYGICVGLLDGWCFDLVYLLNFDVILQFGVIKVLVDYLVVYLQVGIVCLCIVGIDGVLYLIVFCFFSVVGEFEVVSCSGFVIWLLCNCVVVMLQFVILGCVDWLVGVFMMMCSDMLDWIGLFDEGFFLYFEEIDLCLCVVKVGYEIYYVVESVVEYIGLVSMGMKMWKCVLDYWYDLCCCYFEKYYGWIGVFVVMVVVLGGEVLWCLCCLVQWQVMGVFFGYLGQLMCYVLCCQFVFVYVEKGKL